MGVAENPDRINHHLRSHAFLLTQIVPTVLLGNATTFTFYHCFVIGNVQNVFGLNIYSVIMAIRKANNGRRGANYGNIAIWLWKLHETVRI